MTITATVVNRIKRITSLIEANIGATSPGKWYMSHGHVISPGTRRPPLPGQRFAASADFDVCSVPSGKDHKIYSFNTSESGRNDMRYIATVEPTTMKQLVSDVTALLDERDNVTKLAMRIDDLLNNTMGADESPRARALAEAVETYLETAP